jgi:hypothetical protein
MNKVLTNRPDIYLGDVYPFSLGIYKYHTSWTVDTKQMTVTGGRKKVPICWIFASIASTLYVFTSVYIAGSRVLSSVGVMIFKLLSG